MRLSGKCACAFVLAALVGGCHREATPTGAANAKPKPNAPVNADESSFDNEVRGLADRELAVLPSASPVAGPGFTVAAIGGKTQVSSDANGTLLTMDIGTSVPVSCVIYAEPNDAGGTLHAMVQSARHEDRGVRVLPGALTVAGERPVQRLDVLYRQKTSGLGVGVLKLAWIGDFQRPALCYHEELGYSRTFADVVKRIASTLVVTSVERPTRVEITQLTFNGVPTGFELSGEWPEPSSRPSEAIGHRRISYSLSSVALGANYDARDFVSTVHYDARGSMQSGHWAVSSNDTLTLNLTLEHDARGYRVTGSSAGKPIDARLAGAADTLSDGRIDAELSARLLATTPFTQNRKLYAPLVANSAVTEERVQHEKISRVALLERGDEQTRITLDAQGNLSRTETGPAEARLVTELVFVRDGQNTSALALRE